MIKYQFFQELLYIIRGRYEVSHSNIISIYCKHPFESNQQALSLPAERSINHVQTGTLLACGRGVGGGCASIDC